MTLYGLKREELPALWTEFWAMLVRANEADPAVQIEEVATYNALNNGAVVGFYTLDDGRINMAMTVEVRLTYRGKEAEVTALAGVDMEKWLKLIDSLAAWSKSIGCEYLLATGRSGWERMLRDKGFRKVAITVEKVL